MKSAWLVVPTYQEAGNIETTIERVFEAVPNIKKFELTMLIVDSNSPDGTGKLVKNMIKKYGDRLRLLPEPIRGLGQAYDSGFKYAIEHGADILIEMDADLSHDPAVIPELLAEVTKGADLVIGSRYIRGGHIPGDWSLIRIINSRVARFVARKIGAVSPTLSDPTAGFKAISAKALQEIGFKASGATGYVIQVKMVDMFYRKGYKIKEVPISFADRTIGQSKIRPKDIRQFVWFCVQLRRSKLLNQQSAELITTEESNNEAKKAQEALLAKESSVN